MKEGNKQNIAIVHDFLVSYGGAERVLQDFIRMYPEAPVYTLLSDSNVVKRHFPNCDIRTSYVQKFPKWLRKRYRLLLPFYPSAIESLDLREFDTVISSSGAWSKGVVTRLHTKHIAYLHSPMRYVWDENERYFAALRLPFGLRTVGRLFLSYLRVWDKQAADRPDVLVANSRYTAERIRKYYRGEAKVVYPAVKQIGRGDDEEKKERKQYFLIVSRLTEAKRIDIAIEAMNKLELPLVIVGIGPDRKRLEKKAGKTVRCIGWQSEEMLAKRYREARALIHPAEEDFGLAITEALSFGTPVIAYSEGGAKEIVEPGKTGEFFFAQTTEILSDGVRRFLANEGEYNEAEMKRAAAQFSEERFRREIHMLVNQE